jgi:glycosyltransferase involved in cell wall biosynthesis
MKRVGFVLNSLDQNWLGGTHYYINLINAIESYPERKIEPIIFCGYNSDQKLSTIFSNITIIQDHMFDKLHPNWVIRQIVKTLILRDIILERLLVKNNIQILSHSGSMGLWSKIPTIGWIPDFQYKFLPHFFSKFGIYSRNRTALKICKECTQIIFSSNAAKNDGGSFFSKYKEKFRVLHFVPGYMDLENLPDIGIIKEKYSIRNDYFLVPNQFWIHKNHIVILEALKILKSNGHTIKVIATGNTSDCRKLDYFSSLQKKIYDYNISEEFIILGIVPYKELLQLMLHSIAVINPSLFEGWSTTVEEAKLLHLNLILSDIPVHREQNPEQGNFFSPDNAQQLAKILLEVKDNYPKTHRKVSAKDILKNIHIQKTEFAQKYEEIVNETLQKIGTN